MFFKKIEEFKKVVREIELDAVQIGDDRVRRRLRTASRSTASSSRFWYAAYRLRRTDARSGP